ncbi:hypothetical protein W909_04445 [Dickeya zeae EC1]|nr:hypothetical protein W909_04445 [Dickeya zeae EC1]
MDKKKPTIKVGKAIGFFNSKDFVVLARQLSIHCLFMNLPHYP